MKLNQKNVKAGKQAALRRGMLDGLYSPHFIMRTGQTDTSKYKVFVSDAWVIVGATMTQVMDEQEILSDRSVRPDGPGIQRRLEKAAG